MNLNVNAGCVRFVYLHLAFCLKLKERNPQMASWYLRQKWITSFLSAFLSSVCGRWTEAVSG